MRAIAALVGILVALLGMAVVFLLSSDVKETRYFDSLPASERVELLSVVLSQTRALVTGTWGTAEGWARYCGSTVEQERVVLQLSVAFYGRDEPDDNRRLPGALVTRAIEEGWIDLVESADPTEAAASLPMSIALGLPQPGDSGTRIQLHMGRRRQCAVGQRGFGFSATLELTVRRRAEKWEFVSSRTLVIS